MKGLFNRFQLWIYIKIKVSLLFHRSLCFDEHAKREFGQQLLKSKAISLSAYQTRKPRFEVFPQKFSSIFNQHNVKEIQYRKELSTVAFIKTKLLEKLTHEQWKSRIAFSWIAPLICSVVQDLVVCSKLLNGWRLAFVFFSAALLFAQRTTNEQ